MNKCNINRVQTMVNSFPTFCHHRCLTAVSTLSPIYFSINTADLEKASTLTPTFASSPVSSTALDSPLSGALSSATLTGMRNPSIPGLRKTIMKRPLPGKERQPEQGRLSAHGFLLHLRVIGYPTMSLTPTVSPGFRP